jgi:hypothetical protein
LLLVFDRQQKKRIGKTSKKRRGKQSPYTKLLSILSAAKKKDREKKMEEIS